MTNTTMMLPKEHSHQWNQVKSAAKDFITSGEKILKETSLVLLVNTVSVFKLPSLFSSILF
ncbi:uncharacterized protein Bfra_001283 [Botrytis fragariae]|uniref:Uncharacterized protein n=1 Tax=Botrytis fragariae TaxID=1964551 RepID=A0A8H6B0L7_9HELO|nr:uncharacterized protein Bfra_001283 [Botrytis fragariae]KAF5876925.1 hypothetical protein Bfra_001283 [Botrytis fragariae]